MDKLPQALILEILSRLNDSADVARCRLAWKTFDALSSDLRSINLQCSLERYIRSRSRASDSSSSAQITIPFKRIFLNLVSNLRVVDSVRIGTEKPLRDVSYDDVEDEADDLYLTDGNFVKEWLPRVSGELKSLSVSDFWVQSCWRRSNLLPLVSAYCHNLLKLEVKNAWLSVDNLNPMPNLTSLTLEFIRLDDDNLNELNRCFPSLQVLNLIGVGGLKLPTIHLPNLKTCHWAVSNAPSSLSLIAPNLITLRLECVRPTALYVEAPMLAHFHLALDHADTFVVRRFENLKTLWLECLYIGSLCFKFPLTISVEHLTVDSRKWAKGAAGYSNFTLDKLFTVFPTVSSLCINPSAWSELEACYDPDGWEIRRGRRGLKTFRAYLLLVDPLLTFSSVASVVNQCKVHELLAWTRVEMGIVERRNGRFLDNRSYIRFNATNHDMIHRRRKYW
ncbi:F-box/LRR-repeat protein At4g29420 isoform X2 [Cynara cardunculus var. scolymus]|uniref:F-box/LRR-repeat protein At4g29420 isoform X2 n=1 Tax=Cynara cardunculus var. scolymus TaxID=59895 RepID=UPI000D62A292|nr:F-box/LRR-repeat protein At4g29420 isoform X2 [Cynara cardunculus var. scolymus]XP_024958861.1 F-box/LRR-repeat protein At4g29420 isoform X2 [Cynara cardunculus var. scolymus]XP_024958862.1 F-box/LRR-repeat protein At4g29420 isoform X2 [Cynara cardunculus var. scolymus]